MTATSVLFIVLGAVCLVVGMVGCVIPGVPGTPLAWGGILFAFFTEQSSVGWPMLIVTGVITVAVELVNNFVPSFFTNRAGGSKAGSIGSTVGVFVGLFTGTAVGILLGPFVGAFLGELIHDHSDVKRALRSAVWAFLGFITGSGLRLITAAIFAILFVKSFF